MYYVAWEGYGLKKAAEKFGLIVTIGVVAVALFAIAASFTALFTDSDINNSSGPLYANDFSLGWKNSDGISIEIKEKARNSSLLSPDEPLKFSRALVDMRSGDMLYLHSRNLVINIYADGQPVFITSENGHISGAPGFDNYIICGIPDPEVYSEIELEIYRTDYAAQSGIGSIITGSERVIIRKLLGENATTIVIGVIFIVLGVGLIVFGVSTRKKVESYLSSVYYGFFLIFFSLGFVFDTSWAHIVFKNVVFAESGQRIFLIAALPAFLAFIDAFFVTEHVYPVKILTVISVIMFPVLLVLNVTGIATFVDVGTYYLIFVAICGLVVFEELFVFMRKTLGAKSLRRQIDYISVFVYLGTCIIDIFVFLRMAVGNDDLFFSKLGLVFMTAVTIMSWFSEILNMVKLGVQAGRIGKIAFTDANTGIGNVAAFKSEFDELESKKFGHKYIGIVQFDVNNLKVINDSKGHEAGDLLIKTAADIINKSFGKIGNCYRTGGDEFVALIPSDNAPIECENAIFNFNRLIDKFNADEDKPFDLRIAFGIAYYQNDKTANNTLKEIHKIADERMYDNKKMLKARYARTPEEAVIR